MALTLGGALLASALGLLAVRRRGAEALLHHADALVTLRTARTVLGEELRRGMEGRDWAALAGDSVHLRAYRGWATVCSSGSPGQVLARYGGSRQPDPRKDSLLVLGPEGRWRAVTLVARAPSTLRCPQAPELPTERWAVAPPIATPAVVRVFETVSYHLSGGAVRIRRGRGGRQPLTPDALADASTGLRPGPAGGLVLTLSTRALPPDSSVESHTLWAREHAHD